MPTPLLTNQSLDPNNPHVYNPHYFSSITNQTYSDTWLSTIHRLNNALALSFGSLLCLSVIYLVIYKTPYSIRPYSRILLLCLCADVYLLMADLWCRSRLRMNQGILLSSFTGVGSLFESYWIQSYISIPLQASAGMLNCVVVPAQFYYRLYLTRKRKAPSTAKTFIFFAISLFFALLDGILAGPAYYYSTRCQPNFDFGKLWFVENQIPQLIVGALCDNLMFHYLAYTTCLIIGSYSLAIVFGILTMRQLRNDIALQSQRTRQLQRQFNRILMVQAAIPLLLTTLPMSTVVLTAFMNLDTGHIGTLIMMAIAWIPVCNSLTTILFIAPYRQWLFRSARIASSFGGRDSSLNEGPKLPQTTVNTRSLSVEIRR